MSIVPGDKVSASGVKDFFEDLFKTLQTKLGIGKESSVPTEEQFDSASLIEKVNYLEKQIKSLESSASGGHKRLCFKECGWLAPSSEKSYSHPYGGYIYIYGNTSFGVTVDEKTVDYFGGLKVDSYIYRIPFGSSVTVRRSCESVLDNSSSTVTYAVYYYK